MTVLAERFPRWVESVELLPASARFTALREAAESIGAGLEPAAVLDLVGYAVGGDGDASFARVRDAVSANDPSFAAAAADLEPHLVATAAVARALENDDDTAAIVAGAVLSAEFAGLHSPVLELPQLARASQARRFGRLRERVAMPALEFEHLVSDLPDVDDRLLAEEAVERLASATKALAEQLTNVLGGLAQRFETRLDACDEELDVLWWTFAATGRDSAGAAIDSFTPDALVRAGRELADRHRFKAEIPTAREILRRVLGPHADEQFVLADVIASAVGRVHLDAATPGPLLPILTANAACVALRGENGWASSTARYGVDPTITRRGDEIATQTLRELLLARAVRR
jgi:hypothetical protein